MDQEVYERQHNDSIDRLVREFPALGQEKIRETYTSIRQQQEEGAKILNYLPQIVYQMAKKQFEQN